MSLSDQISILHPELGNRLGKESLARLPTPVRTVSLRCAGGSNTVSIKCDDQTGSIYGGNKIRKLEYLLWQARNKARTRVATIGSVGSNHALATALYARSLGLDCTCFLSHQQATPEIGGTLQAHRANNTELVRFGGAYAKRIAILRKYLWNRDCWFIPAGGTSWRGTAGYVNAGLELAAQIGSGELPEPDRIYIATGTMGSAAGLAIGLAMANLPARVEAVRVSPTSICNEAVLERLIDKTVTMLNRLDPTVSISITDKVNIGLRHSFFAGGYAHRDDETTNAIGIAADQLGLKLETTYTGKAMAALLQDAPETRNEQILFWNTYNSVPLTTSADDQELTGDWLPQEFRKYLIMA
jgi:D-cysteine desulfhydrase